MDYQDDDLKKFELSGAAPLPAANQQGEVENKGARIHYSTYGSGLPVVLLHGGLGHSGNWGFQVPDLVTSGHQVILIDSRGHGRSTRDERPYTYDLMGSDVLAVLDQIGIKKAAFVGWSDGACTSLLLGMNSPERVSGVFFFACNMDPSGTKQIPESNPVLGRCFSRHEKDYASLSPTTNEFIPFLQSVNLMMQTEPNSSAQELASIRVPVAIVQSEFDEFIKPEHAEYLARTIPGAELIRLKGVSHFAPLQRPAEFNLVLLSFLEELQTIH